MSKHHRSFLLASLLPAFLLVGVFDSRDRLVVLVSMNSDVSDSWEREGDNAAYFSVFGRDGYALGVDVAVYAMTH